MKGKVIIRPVKDPKVGAVVVVYYTPTETNEDKRFVCCHIDNFQKILSSRNQEEMFELVFLNYTDYLGLTEDFKEFVINNLQDAQYIIDNDMIDKDVEVSMYYDFKLHKNYIRLNIPNVEVLENGITLTHSLSKKDYELYKILKEFIDTMGVPMSLEEITALKNRGITALTNYETHL